MQALAVCQTNRLQQNFDSALKAASLKLLLVIEIPALLGMYINSSQHHQDLSNLVWLRK